MPSSAEGAMQIEVLAAGPLLTIQDLGRSGARRYGVPPGGAMDRFAAEAANRLVGNPPSAPFLEITAGGVQLRFSRSAQIALCGGDLQPRLDSRPVAGWTTLTVAAGSVLGLVGRRGSGARCYLAVNGRLHADVAVGGCGTDLAGGFGGLQGRALRAGDRLEVTPGVAQPLRWWPPERRPAYVAAPTVRLLPGPHSELIGAAAQQLLYRTTWRISSLASRQGFRCEGPALPLPTLSISSLGVLPGAVQVPPDGRPIVLTADAQTTGGYPLIGVVYSADLPLVAQLLPGDALHFRAGAAADARAALQQQRDWLTAGPVDDEGLLLAANAGALPQT